MAKLHIEGASDRPEAIKHYLDFIDKRDYDSFDAVMNDIYRETGTGVVDTKGMQTTLVKLGLVADQNRQQLKKKGEDLVEVLLYDDQLFYELLHFIYTTAYQQNPVAERAISWAYYHISDEYRRRSPVDFNDVRQQVVEAVQTQADQSSDEALADPGALSTRSISNYRRFIEKLDPEVYDYDSGEFSLRSFAKNELVLATIDHLYRTSETREYGDPVEVSGDTVDQMCTILLVQEEDLTDLIEHVASMDSRLSITADYQFRVRLNNPVEINELA